MVTEFGKMLRIIRINCGDSAKDMADKLKISASYLSAIENGKRNIPEELIATIFENYVVSEKEKIKLKKAVVNSCDKVKINLSEFEEKKKELFMALSQENLSDETLDMLCEVIKKNK